MNASHRALLPARSRSRASRYGTDGMLVRMNRRTWSAIGFFVMSAEASAGGATRASPEAVVFFLESSPAREVSPESDTKQGRYQAEQHLIDGREEGARLVEPRKYVRGDQQAVRREEHDADDGPEDRCASHRVGPHHSGIDEPTVNRRKG